MATTTEIERLVVRMIGDASSFISMLDRAMSQTTRMADVIERQLARAQQAFNTLAASIAAPIVAGLGVSAKAYASFNDAITYSLAIFTSATDKQKKAMEELALSLSTVSNRSAKELAESFFFLGSAGLNAAQSLKALPAVLNFATAGNFDLNRATTLALDAQAALGLKSADAAENLVNLTRVTDALTRGNILANTTIEQLSMAMTHGAAAAMKTFNIELADGVATLAAMAEAGIKAELAGNNLSRVMRLMTQATLRYGEAHKAFGFTVFDTAGQMRPLVDIVENLEKILLPLSPEMRAATLAALGFEARIQQAILPLIGMSGRMREFREELRNTSGITKEIAEKVLGSFGNQMRMVGNTIQIVAISIGEMLAPALRQLGGMISNAASFFLKLNPTLTQSAITVAAITAGFLALSVSVIAAARAFVFLFGGMGLLTGGAFAGIVVVAATIASAVAALGGIGPTIAYLREQFGGIIDSVREVQDGIVTFATLVVTHFGAINDALAPVRADILSFFQSFIKSISEWVSKNAGMIAGIAGTVAALGLLYVGLSTIYSISVALGIRWLVVNGVLLTLKATVLVYNATLIAAKIIMAAYTGAIFVLTTALGMTKAMLIAMGVAASAVTTIMAGNNAMAGIGVVGFAAYKIVISLFTGAIWAANASLVVMKGLLAILAVVLTGSVIVTGFVVIGAAVLAVYQTAVKLYDVLATLPLTAGPIAHITGLFVEWYNILRDVVRIAQTDMKGAWVVLAAGFKLAVSEVRDLLPPLWQFIQEGFVAVWDFISVEFKLAFNENLQYILKKITGLPGIFTTLSPGIVGAANFGLAKLKEEVDSIIKGADAAVTDAGKAGGARPKMTPEEEKLWEFRKKRSDELWKTLHKSLTEFKAPASDATRMLKEDLEFLKRYVEMGPKLEITPETTEDTARTARTVGEIIGHELGDGIVQQTEKELKRLDAVLFKSAAAVSRIYDYREALVAEGEGKGGGFGKGSGLAAKAFRAVAGSGGLPGGEKREGESAVEYLRRIHDLLREGAKKPPIEVKAPGLGGAPGG